MRCILDYETRSELNLKKVSVSQYAKHPSTSLFCVGYRVSDDGPLRLWIPEKGPIPADLFSAFKSGILVAHNATFERAITRYCLTRYDTLTVKERDVLSNIPASRWRCTAAKAASVSLPRSLEGAARVLGLKTQKDLHGHKLIQKYCKPRKPSKKDPSRWWHDKKDLRDIYRYCMIDVKAEYELDKRLRDLIPLEQQVWELDQKINDRGVLIDTKTVRLVLKMIDEETKQITRNVQKLSCGTIDKVTQTARVLTFVNGRGAKMPNLKADTIRDKLLSQGLSEKARRMLEYRQNGSKTSTAKYVKMLQAVDEDDRARELFLYCGAQATGRWSGKRIQLQNLPRVTVKNFNSNEAIELIKRGDLNLIRQKYGPTQVMPVLVSSIRGMLIAPPGREFYCADFSSVELRLTFWVAGHEEGLKAIRDGRKIYEEMASATFNIPLEKVTKESIERFVGKESVLGCGYGMGPPKFHKNCHQKGVPQVTEEMARKAVYTYRKVHWPVPQAWKNIENTVIDAIKHPGSTHVCHKVLIFCEGDFLKIRLPSGRYLHYYKPRISYKPLGSRMVPVIKYWAEHKHQWCEVRAWGGVFFNNIVQGIARDLEAHSLKMIENAGYEVDTHTHDEILSEQDKNKGDLKEYIKLMTKLPSWAKGAPISAEGWVDSRYRK